jgi:hypothetical protein
MNSVLSEIPDYQQFLISYMDDLLIYSRNQTEHLRHVRIVLETLKKHQLKISPKKSLFFRSKVEYLGHNIEIIKGKPHITAQVSKIESIKRLKVPKTLKQIRGFCGAVNYVARFIPNLSELLKPLRKLTRKNTRYFWDDSCQQSFEKIKRLLCEAPVLALPTREGLIKLYIDTSRTGTGCSIYQTDPDDPDKEHLLGYFSRSLPDTASRYSVSELELFGICECVQALKFLRSRYFHIHSDHSSLIQMIKSKKELATNRLKKLFERISGYQFDLYYTQGSKMVVCDYLSRAEYHTKDQVSKDSNYPEDRTVFPVTRGQAEKQGVKVPEVKESMKKLEKVESRKRKQVSKIGDLSTITEVSEPDTSDEPEVEHVSTLPVDDDPLDQSRITAEQAELIEPSITQTEVSMSDMGGMPRTSTPIKQRTADDTAGKSQVNIDNTETQIPVEKIDEADPGQVVIESVDPHDPDMTPYIKNNTLVGKGVSIPLENVPVPKSTMIPVLDQRTKDQGAMYDTYMAPTGKEFQKPTDLFKDILKHDIVYKKIPNQLELDKFLNQVRERSLRDFTIPLRRLHISQQQRRDPYFEHIWHYLDSGALPGNARQARTIKLNAEDYVMVKQVLFRIIESKQKNDYKMVLAVPEESVPYILAMEHDTLFSSHKGISKSYYTLKEKYFIPKLFDKLVQYIQSCAICQKRKIPNQGSEQLEYIPRVNASFKIMENLHTDVKYLNESSDHFKYLLVVVDESTRFCMAFPLRRVTAAAVAEILLQKICLFFGPFSTITFDEGKENMNKIMAYLTRALGIQMKFVAVGHHQSNLSERYISTIGSLLVSKLQGHGRNWPMYVNAVTYSINVAQHTVLQGFSSYELVFGRKPKDFLNLELDQGLEMIPLSYRDYAHSIKSRLEETSKLANDLQNSYQEKQRLERSQRVKIAPPYAIGDLCWLLMPSHSELTSNTRKVKANYIGPLLVSDVIDERNCCLQDLQGRNLHGLFNVKRLKRAHFRTSAGSATNIKQVKNAVEIMDAQRQQIPEIQVEARGFMCMRDHSQPPCHNLNDYLKAENGSEQLSSNYNIQLSSYFTHQEKSNVAILRTRPEKEIKNEMKRENKLPRQDETMEVLKGKYVLGELHLYCKYKNGYGDWFHISSFSKPGTKELLFKPVVDSNRQPTGRVYMEIPVSQANVDKPKSIRIIGSELKFVRQLSAKPSMDEYQRRKCKLKKVKFDLDKDSANGSVD